jgi:hypothetical protein
MAYQTITLDEKAQKNAGKRVSAWAQVIGGDSAGIITCYQTDLIHDGATLTLREGPFAALVYDCGTHMSDDSEWMESVRFNFGSEEDGKRHWYFGYGTTDRYGEYVFRWERMTADNAIDRLKLAKATI